MRLRIKPYSAKTESPRHNGSDGELSGLTKAPPQFKFKSASQSINDKGLQNSNVIQSKAGILDENSILDILKNTEFIVGPALDKAKQSGKNAGDKISLADKLDQSTTAQDRDTITKETLKTRLAKTIKQFQAGINEGYSDRSQNAIMLSLAIDSVAKAIADELYDPGLKPKLAEHIFKLYETELKAGMNKQNLVDVDTSFLRAKVMSSADPFALYMHDEMKKEHAVFQIRKMATEANVKLEYMFTSLKSKFEAEMASYTLEDIEKQDNNSSAYNTKEATGEISANYFNKLFDKSSDKKSNPKIQNGGLSFIQSAQNKIDDLKNEVLSDKAITDKDLNDLDTVKSHLDEVKSNDDKVRASRTNDVLQVLTDPTGSFKLSNTQAQKAISNLKKGLSNLPITITANSLNWFTKDNSVENFDPSSFKLSITAASGSHNKAKLDQLLGKNTTDTEEINYSGKWTGQSERGENYLRFRNWKDRKMFGNRQIDDSQLPVFGAVNAHWKKAYGSSTTTNDYLKNQKAVRKFTGRLPELQDMYNFTGANYYGDMHFLLKKNKIMDRMVYTATDHGTPHTDPFMMLADCLAAPSDNEYSNNVTGLKDVKDDKNAKLLIAGALNTKEIFLSELPFEVQIFGGIDIKEDVEAVYVSPGIPDNVLANMKNAFKQKGIKTSIIKKIPKIKDINKIQFDRNKLNEDVNKLLKK